MGEPSRIMLATSACQSPNLVVNEMIEILSISLVKETFTDKRKQANLQWILIFVFRMVGSNHNVLIDFHTIGIKIIGEGLFPFQGKQRSND